MSNCCSVCMRELGGTDWLCNNCAKLHEVEGVAFKDWPEYLKELVMEEQQSRRYDKRMYDAGITLLTFSECPEAEMMAYGEYIEEGCE